MLSATHGTLLSALEFRDALSYRYSIEPSNLQPRCNGCGAKFSLDHGLTCMKGGLINARHNEIRDELCDLASKAFSPSAVRDEPSIFLGCSVDGNNVNVSETMQQTAPAVEQNLNKTVEGGERGDVLIRGLWENGTDAIIDVRVTNLDAKSYREKDLEKALAQQEREREKKKKYLQACLDQRRHFSPFVMSIDTHGARLRSEKRRIPGGRSLSKEQRLRGAADAIAIGYRGMAWSLQAYYLYCSSTHQIKQWNVGCKTGSAGRSHDVACAENKQEPCRVRRTVTREQGRWVVSVSSPKLVHLRPVKAHASRAT